MEWCSKLLWNASAAWESITKLCVDVGNRARFPTKINQSINPSAINKKITGWKDWIQLTWSSSRPWKRAEDHKSVLVGKPKRPAASPLNSNLHEYVHSTSLPVFSLAINITIAWPSFHWRDHWDEYGATWINIHQYGMGGATTKMHWCH